MIGLQAETQSPVWASVALGGWLLPALRLLPNDQSPSVSLELLLDQSPHDRYLLGRQIFLLILSIHRQHVERFGHRLPKVDGS